MDIGKRILEVARERKISLRDIASQMQNERKHCIGITQPSLSTMLKGSIPFWRVNEIANIIGITMVELVAVDGLPVEGVPVIVCPSCGTPIALNPVSLV